MTHNWHKEHIWENFLLIIPPNTTEDAQNAKQNTIETKTHRWSKKWICILDTKWKKKKINEDGNVAN